MSFNYKIDFSSNGFDFVLYQNLSLKDSLTVLTYRNHINIRKWMHNSEEISKDNHLLFIRNLNNNNEKKYYAVFKNHIITACVYFDIISEGEYFTGHFLNPKFLSTGMGLYFEYVYLKFFFEYLNAKMIKATVKKENLAMIKIHRLCGFKESSNQNSLCYNYEYNHHEYNNIPDNVNDFITKLILKYKIKDEHTRESKKNNS